MSWISKPRMANHSIANKLMLIYSLSTLMLLGAIALFLYPTVHQLLLQTTDDAALSVECLKKIILSFMFAAIFILVLGNYMATKTLNHIKQFQQTMETISAHDLHERLNIQACPSELKPLGRCFNDMLERINQGFLQLNQFSSDIAHELRHPIHNLMQITELALSSSTTSKEQHLFFADLMTELKQLTQLIDQLLFMARSENGQISLDIKQVSANELLTQVSDLYQAWADEKKITLKLIGDAILHVEPSLLQRAISNLLANAIRHTPQGGSVILTTLSTVAGAQIQIADSGHGIEAVHLPHLCKRLYRIDSTRNPTEQRLGLGLAMVKSIMDLHGGEIKIESEVGKGTRITLGFHGLY